MKKITHESLIEIFENIFRSDDRLVKLVSIHSDSSKIKEEFIISLSITSDQQKIIQSMNIDDSIEEYITGELKEFIFNKCADFVYSNNKLTNCDSLEENVNLLPNEFMLLGGSSALSNLSDDNDIVKILDHNKRFNDHSIVIFKKINLFLDYNSIKIQTIGLAEFIPQLNLKFNFSIES